MGTLAEAQELLNTMDSGRRLLIQNRRGGPSVNPLLGIIRKASRDAVLGLTPSARATLEVKPQPNDPMDKYFGSKS
jgi:phage terminase small subunit